MFCAGRQRALVAKEEIHPLVYSPAKYSVLGLDVFLNSRPFLVKIARDSNDQALQDSVAAAAVAGLVYDPLLIEPHDAIVLLPEP